MNSFTPTKAHLSMMIGLLLIALVCSTARNCASTATPAVGIAEADETYSAAVDKAITDAAAVDNVETWAAAYGEASIQGLGYKKSALERRTKRILNASVREAGQKFLSAIVEVPSPCGADPSYVLDRSKLVGIDEEKLKRWAAIALVFLEIVEPFVPPPYNLAVHAAVMLLKLYLAEDNDPVIRGYFTARAREDGRPIAFKCVLTRHGSNFAPLMAPKIAA